MSLIKFIYTSNKELWVPKQKNRLSEKLGKPYFMLFVASSPFDFKARDKKVHWTFLFCDWVNRNFD